MELRPIDIAKRLKISTSALRHYESWGLVPAPTRKKNGYRVYKEEHLAYFECIRAMYPAFDMKIVSKVMKNMQNNNLAEALWIVSEAEATLHQDKVMAMKTMAILETKQLDQLDKKLHKKWMTIGEVAEETGTPPSAIRHWEKEGLITPNRNPENGYRQYTATHIKQILVIRTLRTAIYSLEVIKEVIHELDHNNLDHARKIAHDSIHYLNQVKLGQLKGVYYLYRLAKKLKLLEE